MALAQATITTATTSGSDECKDKGVSGLRGGASASEDDDGEEDDTEADEETSTLR